jgi:low affinity Fe/Cu permease
MLACGLSLNGSYNNLVSSTGAVTLDELLRAMESARTSLVDLEHRSDADLDQVQAEFRHLRKQQGKALEPCPGPEETQTHHKNAGEQRLRS